MHFLPDVYVQCDVCKGRRYNRETLEVLLRSKSIADVLDMTVDEGTDFFRAVPSIRDKLLTLQQVGLGYIHIGQPATTLSGGERQRVKLAKELSRRATGRTLYILDEPTTGLHFDDVRKLLEVLHALVETGNTVLVIEHRSRGHQRPPTGSSISAPRAAMPAATSSRPAPPKTSLRATQATPANICGPTSLAAQRAAVARDEDNMARLETLLAEAAAALATLEEAVGKEPRSLIERDSAILRLIYTLAMVWKACRHLLAEREGIEVASPNSTIRAARRLGWLSDEDVRGRYTGRA